MTIRSWFESRVYLLRNGSAGSIEGSYDIKGGFQSNCPHTHTRDSVRKSFGDFGSRRAKEAHLLRAAFVAGRPGWRSRFAHSYTLITTHHRLELSTARHVPAFSHATGALRAGRLSFVKDPTPPLPPSLGAGRA